MKGRRLMIGAGALVLALMAASAAAASDPNSSAELVNVLVDDFETTLKPIKRPQVKITSLARLQQPAVLKTSAGSRRKVLLTRPYDMEFANAPPKRLHYRGDKLSLLLAGGRQGPTKLIKSQHRGSWRWRLEDKVDLVAAAAAARRRNQRPATKPRFTTPAPMTTTTTEFFRLISSAHSPIKVIKLGQEDGESLRASGGTPQPEFRSMSNNHAAPPSRVLSPTITVTGGGGGGGDDDEEPDGEPLDSAPANDDDAEIRHKQEDSRRPPSGQAGGNISISSVLQFDDDQPLPGSEFTTQLTPRRQGAHDGSAPKTVTIVRLPPGKRRPRPRPAPPTEAPAASKRPPEREAEANESRLTRSSTAAPRVEPAAQQLVRLIAKQRHKYDDRVMSPTLTVVDNDAVRLPPNATSVHNNKLIVAIRPGRPRRPQPSTTQFPVYNIVAGITPPYSAPPSQAPHLTRPPPSAGPGYGLLARPPAWHQDHSAGGTTPLPFGSPNIRFPAASGALSDLQLPDRFNLTLAGDQLKAPDKIQIQEEPPAETVVQSDATIVARPYGQETSTNQEGLMVKLKTTRRPQRGQTTPRVSIVSANTTIVAGNPEQLHDVLSNVIAGSHHNGHHLHQSQRPGQRPGGLFAHLAGLFGNGLLASLMGALTLVKTILVALLVMFLPPMALAAAIMQAINIG